LLSATSLDHLATRSLAGAEPDRTRRGRLFLFTVVGFLVAWLARTTTRLSSPADHRGPISMPGSDIPGIH